MPINNQARSLHLHWFIWITDSDSFSLMKYEWCTNYSLAACLRVRVNSGDLESLATFQSLWQDPNHRATTALYLLIMCSYALQTSHMHSHNDQIYMDWGPTAVSALSIWFKLIYYAMLIQTPKFTMSSHVFNTTGSWTGFRLGCFEPRCQLSHQPTVPTVRKSIRNMAFVLL